MTNWPSSENSPNKTLLHPPPPPSVPLEVRVRYSETDQMGVAHNKAYLEWFELGRTEYCRHQGLPYKAIEERGTYLVVVEAYCRYKRPLHYDDAILVLTSLRHITPKKVAFSYEVRIPGRPELIAEGYTVHVAVDREGAVAALPDDILKKISAPLSA